MHTDRIARLADIIERETERPFHMGTWDSCIAGFCLRHLDEVVADPAEAKRLRRRYDPMGYAKERSCRLDFAPVRVSTFANTVLGLPGDHNLFLPAAAMRGMALNDRRHAAKVLRHLAATSTVNWKNPTKVPERMPTPEEKAVRRLFAGILARVKRNERTIRAMERKANARLVDDAVLRV